jgi:hypothetical protein
MVMQIIVFTIVTMTEGLEYCYDEDEASNWPLGTWLGKKYKIFQKNQYIYIYILDIFEYALINESYNYTY